MSDVGAMPARREIIRGLRVLALDASGEWREKIADSGVHAAGPCDECAAGRHNFAIVFLRPASGTPRDSVAWPYEDVRLPADVPGGAS
jgi:hypothetical protein